MNGPERQEMHIMDSSDSDVTRPHFAIGSWSLETSTPASPGRMQRDAG